MTPRLPTTAMLFLVAFVQPVCAQQTASPWAGYYVGAHGGYLWSTFSNSDDSNDKLDIKGFVGGVQLGYLWQWNYLVAGIESDVSFANGRWNGSAYAGGGAGDATITLDWLASIRGRIGWDIGPALLYATGGIAWTDWSMRAHLIDAFGNSGTLTAGSPALGWVVGGGAEFHVTRSIVARLEGLHYRFDSSPTDIKINGTRVPEFDTRIDQSVTVLRTGLSWRF